MPTDTFYAVLDGEIESASTSGSWSNARAGTGDVLSASTSETNVAFGVYHFDTNYGVYQGFLSFDTSTIPAGATITSVTLSLYFPSGANVTTGSSASGALKVRLKDWGSSLTTGDYVAGASLTGLTLLAQRTTNVSSGVYGDFTSEAAFASNINTSGFTRLLLHSAKAESSTAPTGLLYTSVRSQNNSGTTQDPKLVVTYTVPSTTVSTGLVSVPVTVHSTDTRVSAGLVTATVTVQSARATPQMQVPVSVTVQPATAVTGKTRTGETVPVSVTVFTAGIPQRRLGDLVTVPVTVHGCQPSFDILNAVPIDTFQTADAWLDGLALMLMEQEVDNPYQLVAPDQRVERTDLSEELSENRLDKLWWSSNRSWHQGAGQKRLQVPNVSSPYGYLTSKGIDISDKAKAKLLHATDLLGSTINYHTNPIHLAVANDFLWATDVPNALRRYTTTDGAFDTFYTGVDSTHVVKDLCSDGPNLYIALDGQGIRRITSTHVGSNAASWSATRAELLCWAKARLFACGVSTDARYQLASLDTTGAATQVFLFPPGEVPVSMVELKGFLYVAVQSGQVISKVYGYDGTNASFVALSLPPGDLATGLTPFHGTGLLIGAARYQGASLNTGIVYVGFPDANGHLTLLEREILELGTATTGRNYAIRDGVQWRNIVYFPWPYDDACGLGAYMPENAAYFRHLFNPDAIAEEVGAVAVWRGRLAFSVKGQGVYLEQTTYVDEGTLESSILDINVDVPKTWVVQETGFEPLPSGASVSHAFAVNGGSYFDELTQVNVLSQLLRSNRRIIANQVQYRIRLASDPSHVSTPVVTKSGMGGWPTAAALNEHRLLLRAYTAQTFRNQRVEEHDDQGYELLAALLSRRDGRRVMDYQPPWWMHSRTTLRVRISGLQTFGPWGKNGPKQGGGIALTLQEVP